MFYLLDIIFPPRKDEDMVRTIPSDDFLALTHPQLVPITRPATITLLPFHNPHVRSAIHEAKYHGTSHAQRTLALTLAEYLREDDEHGTKAIVIPVPLSNKRMQERGFNQIHEVTQQALRNLGNRYARVFSLEPNLLARTRETTSQVSLPRQKREENMRDAFVATCSLDSTYTYIVIDDVLTTGATLQAAIDALKTAGAVHIIPIALAH